MHSIETEIDAQACNVSYLLHTEKRGQTGLPCVFNMAFLTSPIPGLLIGL